MPLILQRYPGQSYLRLGHSPALFFRLFGHDGAPSLPQSLKNIARRLTALRLTFIVEPALMMVGYGGFTGGGRQSP